MQLLHFRLLESRERKAFFRSNSYNVKTKKLDSKVKYQMYVGENAKFYVSLFTHSLIHYIFIFYFLSNIIYLFLIIH